LRVAASGASTRFSVRWGETVARPSKGARIERDWTRSFGFQVTLAGSAFKSRSEFFKVYGIGDMYAPKHASLQEDQRYRNVRIIAVYGTNHIPALKS
jgi:hypothetical protein